MSVPLERWRAAFSLGQRLGVLPREAAEAALEDMAARPPAELTPALVAFWVDLPEAQLEELLDGSAGEDTGVEGSGVSRPGQVVEPTLLQIGAEIGDFVLQAPLGAGGMGQVFRARQRSLARDVALKVLSPALAQDPEGQRRFLREARTLAKLSHPRVVTCYQVGQTASGQPFMAMELMRGGDAAGLAKRAGGSLSEADALGLCRDAAEALVAFEAAGLVHRDLKPQNLFLDDEGRAKLGDLGLARSSQGADRMTLTGVAVGTLPFMSPEQLAGEGDLDVRSDLYALGATLQALLTGKAPRVNQGPPQGLDASPRTVAFVRRCMTQDRERRYPSAAAALVALQEALAGLSGRGQEAACDPAPRAAPAPEARRWGPYVLGGAGVALAALLALSQALGPQAPGVGTPERPPRALAEAPTASAQDEAPTASAQHGEDAPAVREPAERPEPAPQYSQVPDEPEPRADPAGPLRGLPVYPPGQSLSEAPPGTYTSRPNPGEAWGRAAAFDPEARRLPLRVRWTLTAAPARDSGPLADWERGHGFAGPAAVFFELGLRDENAPITAARELGEAWWLSLSVGRDGRAQGLVRQANRQRPGNSDLIAVAQPGLPRVPGVAILERFACRLDLRLPIAVDLDATRDGWTLTLSQADRELARERGRWSASAAPLPARFADAVHLWSHTGNFSGGAGESTFQVEVR
ncbi:MAG: protein kinase [Planctomycetota bacterium]